MFKVSYGYKKEKRDARSNCLGSKETKNEEYVVIEVGIA